MDKRDIGDLHGKAGYLQKRVPKNPKYADVQATVKTGTHMNHVEVVSDQKISKRKGELFRRIKPATLMNFLKQETNGESIYNLVDKDKENVSAYGDHDDSESVYSHFTSQTGYTEASKISSVTAATDNIVLGDISEFLLLDLRDAEDYELYHIKESINYPAPNLGRDKMIPELYKFKNSPGKLIVVYHLDERSGIPHANSMAQKGYENVYLLNGGVEAFLEAFPEAVEGKKVPAPLKQEKKSKVVYKRSLHVGDPVEGGVSIPSKNYEDQKSTKTSGLTSSNKLNQSKVQGQTQSSLKTVGRQTSNPKTTTKI